MAKSKRVTRPAGSTSILTTLHDWQEAMQAFDAAWGDKLGLIVAEQRCLSALVDGPKPAGVLAQASGLTPAAATSMIDRLEKRGFVERQRDGEDRRKVFVALTRPAADTLQRFRGPLTDGADELLRSFSEAELEVIERFVKAALTLQRQNVERVEQTELN